MSRLALTLAVLALLGVFGDGKHIHIAEPQDNDTDPSISELRVNVESAPNDFIRNYQSSGFVPMNNILFFKAFPSCEEGFKRDILGICREVWD